MVTYKDAGVDIDASNKAKKLIKSSIKETYTDNVVTGIANFGGMFRVPSGYKKPILVSSTDGVGTKLKLAYKYNIHDTVGQDLVNHCVNDILVQGAIPLYFLDYMGNGKVSPEVVCEVVKGVAKACKEAGCALIGGETAEMPGIYNENEYDLASTIVGIVEEDSIVDGSEIKVGDKIIGLKSNGLMTNGYSLALKVLNTDEFKDDLMAVHPSFLNTVKPVLSKVKGMAHITGGGLVENIPRILPSDVDAKLDKSSWEVLPIFKAIQEKGDVPEDDMFRTFNMGIGFVLIGSDPELEKLDGAVVIGEVVTGSGKVVF